MTAATLSEYSGPQLLDDEALRADIRDIYAEAFSEPPYRDDPQRAAEWADGPLRRHALLPGFHLVTAAVDGHRTGFAYGALGTDDSWFADYIRTHTPAAIHSQWLPGRGELAELAVRADHRGRGTGGRLHDAVVERLAALGAERMILVAQEQALPARRLYLGRGWRDLAELSPGSRLMGLRLPSGEAAHRSHPFGTEVSD